MTFLGSVPFLLRLLASFRDIGAVEDDVDADAEGAGDISGLLGGETLRPHPNRPLKKPAVAERLRDLGTGGPVSLDLGTGDPVFWASSS